MLLPENLLQKITAAPVFQRLVNLTRAYEEHQNLALPRAARLAAAAAFSQALGVPVLFITDRADHALTLADELKYWAPDSPRYLFPEPTPLFYEITPWNESTRRDRLQVLSALSAYHIPGTPQSKSQSIDADLSRAEERRQIWEKIRGPDAANPPIFITPVRALMTRTLPRREFLKHTRTLKSGQRFQPDTLAREWVSIGFEPTHIVVAPGQFSRRGGLLDIWPPGQPLPIRIDFFDDEIDILRTFHPATQRTEGKLDRVLISPAREFIQPNDKPTDQESDEQSFSEFNIPELHHPSTLLDYLPDSTLILIEDADAIETNTHDIESQSLELRDEMVRDNLLSEDFPLPYVPWDELSDAISFKRYLILGPSSAPQKSDLARMFTPNPRFGGRIAALLDHMLHQTNRGDQVIIISQQAPRLRELWDNYTPSSTLPEKTSLPQFMEGTLADGFILSPPGEKRVHVLADGEIFGWRRPQPRKHVPTHTKAPETAYADLQVGDWVVHVDHGIGRFMGLVHRTLDEIEREFLTVEYDNGDQLFVPVHQADRLNRYVGPDGRTPKATRLGGAEWKRAKQKVEKAVEEMAEDLLELYAKRQIVQGHPFNPDSDWQRELEASFPYTETVDQLRVINEVKSDMESSRPMDRLICGDVGYGKTEVALRAAFKSVMDGKQVAVLVPTTVLAQQHYDTFRERLAPFPVNIQMLSRFRTHSQQQEILKRAADGFYDIVIGTHRLLSGDVVFKDLGLLIIDEEQRFGVTHKEKIKQLRTEVDVLTMTATPIPRTLYMALTGVRDISTINTPPEERLPIITHVGPYSQKQVRHAILREMERGGQVFFVHNRVQTIWAMRHHIAELVPEAKLGVAHGQMNEKKLSKRMREFAAGEIDVLLSTTIIESGLDIPNANTLIVDRADTFGLAQLYQLRGRVGRGAHQAYSYFFRHRKKAPTLEGRMRLETLAENTQLGAGFSIAMRDLEIRGAGDLLGTRQHGHIAAVGFHLYTRLLAQAVKQQRKGSSTPLETIPLRELIPMQETRPLVNVDIPLPASIPPTYIEDQDTRLRLYRRLADIREVEKVDGLEAEFNDRFGPPPEAVFALLYQIKIKLLAEKAGAIGVFPEDGQMVIRFPSLARGAPARPLPYLGENIRTGKNSVRLLRIREQAWQDRLVEILETLGEFNFEPA